MIQIDDTIECPECGGLAELEDSHMDYKRGVWRPIWAEYRCPECGHKFTKDFCIDFDFEEM